MEFCMTLSSVVPSSFTRSEIAPYGGFTLRSTIASIGRQRARFDRAYRPCSLTVVETNEVNNI